MTEQNYQPYSRKWLEKKSILVSEFPELSGEIVVDRAVERWFSKSQTIGKPAELVQQATENIPSSLFPDLVDISLEEIAQKISEETEGETQDDIQKVSDGLNVSAGQEAFKFEKTEPEKIQPLVQEPEEKPVIEYSQKQSAIARLAKELSETISDVLHKIPSLIFPKVSVNKRALKFVGNFLIGVSLFGVIFLSSPFLALELRSAVYQATNAIFPQAQNVQPSPVPETGPVEKQQEVIPPEEQRFRIKIPKIGVDSNVVANVDTSNQKEYEEALKQGVAHAKGTGLPGEDGDQNKTIFIFSHSTNATWNITRYNALFYSLKDLNPEDEVDIVFWGKEFKYKITEKKVIEADDTTSLLPQKEKEVLILQTCWPPGTTWKRLIVVAERMN